jgi:hypothetical protein
MSLHVGFWRESQRSANIYKCPKDESCLGGYNKGSSPVNCDIGYGGILCTVCESVNGTDYSRTGNNSCDRCANPLFNALRIIGAFFGIVVWIILLIWINIRRTGKSNTSTLFRIITNYCQIVASTLSMNLSYPKLVESAFGPLKASTESTSVFLSIDCFVKDLNLTSFSSSTFILKVLMTSLSPFLLITCIILFWCGIRIVFRVHIFRKAVNSILTLIFFFYPTITLMNLSLFDC